ncbi:MAG: hypothetical protein NTX56_15140 [Proteobacteria bacterium]|nr:hypothetical protein [Pseudomonadota bacterium]
MPQRRILFLDANRLSAYRWADCKLLLEESFTTDTKGEEAFAAYLPAHKKSHFYLLAEVVEEGFQADVIPHVQGSDRKALLRRKVDQYFYGTPLNLSVTLGRETTGRRDDKVLFFALTRPEYFEPWLAALRTAQCQLAGVYSVPLVANSFVNSFSRKAQGLPQHFLLVTLTCGGLRQSFFDDGRLRFSRLTPLPGNSTDEIATACAVESTRIHQYLIGQRLMERGAALTTLVLVHPEQTESFRAHCVNSNDLNFEFIDLVAESGKFGLKSIPTDSHGEALLMHVLVRKTPSQQFAEAGERRLYRMWQTRLLLNSGAMVIFLSCLIFSGKQLIQLYQLRESTDQVQQQTEVAGQQYAAALKTLPKMPFSSNSLRALIERYDTLVKHTVTLEPTYQRISEALQQESRVELDRIDWKVSNNAGEAAPAPDSVAKQPAAAKIVVSGELFVIADIYAQLPVALKNDERTLKNIIDKFSGELSKDGKVQIRILKLPFDVESTKSLKSTDEESAIVEVPKFSLRMVQKL